MDDEDEKIKKIRSVLENRCLVNSANIEEARSLNDGRRLLAQNFYDILVLDLVIPVDANEELRPQESESFINELTTFGRLKKPVYIIGLSVHKDAIEANISKFETKLWKLIHFDIKSTKWEEVLQNAVDTILSTKRQMEEAILHRSKFDYGILCALPDEFEQMKKASGAKWERFAIPNVKLDFFKMELRTENGRTLRIVSGCSNMSGMQATAVMASSMLSVFDLKALFITGFCAGFKKDANDKINLGDIFIAESEYDYGSGKLTVEDEEQTLKARPKPFECNFELRNKVNTFIQEFDPANQIMKPLKENNLNFTSAAPQIFFKPGACGSYVVADENFMKSLLSKYPELRGLEMEGYGLYIAGHILERPCLLVKGIADLGDKDKDDRYHVHGAFSSAWFVFNFLKYTY